MTAHDAAGAPRPAPPPDLWWSPSMARFLSRHEDQDDEHLVWVWHGHHESLRHYLGTGLDSNPPMPDDAVQLVPAAERDGLQARIDATLGKLDAYDGYGAGMMFHDELRATLQGDQPAERRARRYPGECQNPGCTREDGVCIGYHCPSCGKPTTSMGHPECYDRAAAGEADRG